MNKINIEQQFGAQCKADSRFVRKCRLLQSWYRVTQLKETECGPWREGGRCVGSSLLNGKQSGKNFITTVARDYATSKVAGKKVTRDLIDEHRLFNNMLSSQPMCFNQFSDLRAGVLAGSAVATRVLAAMFAESRITEVEEVEVEITRDYIGDKTAFDAGILFRGRSGPGLVSVETKYSDNLAANYSSDQTRQWKLANEDRVFTPLGIEWYRKKGGFDQIARNLLLTIAYSRRHGRDNAINYVLALAEDTEARCAVETLREQLTERYREKIILLPLEEVVSRGLAVADEGMANVLEKFRSRYLDFSPVEAML